MFVYLTKTHTSKKHETTKSNAIRVTLFHRKGDGFQLSFTGCTRNKEDPVGNYTYSPLFSPKMQTLWEPGQRDSKKKIQSYSSLIYQQISNKSGRAWDLLSTFAKEQGMEIE